MVILSLHVPGAHCGVCRGAVLTTLRSVPGVHDAELDLRTRVATVRVDPAVVDAETLCERLADAGYPATQASAKGDPSPPGDAASGRGT